ncbi:MAG: hypothetical protein L6Q57_00645 [Alphaproteobacteria bacterium]|nr:hypothetical protein [Alphaproteobacteria bacterium]
MTTITGASGFVNAIKIGVTNTAPNLLGGSDNILSGSQALDILSAGKNALKVRGSPGISATSRAMNDQLIAESISGGNKILSLAAGADSNTTGSEIIIKALRAKTPTEQLAHTLVEVVDKDGKKVEGGSDKKGSKVDTKA